MVDNQHLMRLGMIERSRDGLGGGWASPMEDAGWDDGSRLASLAFPDSV